jgi:hypothetical protein
MLRHNFPFSRARKRQARATATFGKAAVRRGPAIPNRNPPSRAAQGAAKPAAKAAAKPVTKKAATS